ncbi:MAG: chorismate mutase [Pseudomonadota bacterium]
MSLAPAPKTKQMDAVQKLDEIRAEIDRIDAAMHALLIERSSVVSDLIEAKKIAPSGGSRQTSAFRPAREASMMRAIVQRHEGLLPVDTVESIWRVIISTFTFVQAPYEVIYAEGAVALAMRDVARFHFGYTVPVRAVGHPGAVLDAVGTRGDALGVVPMSFGGSWWKALEANGAPSVIARLPFVARQDHPAGEPCLVIANAPIDPEVMAASVYSLQLNSAHDVPDGVDVLCRDGLSVLASVNERMQSSLNDPKSGINSAVKIGSHAPIFHGADA